MEAMGHNNPDDEFAVAVQVGKALLHGKTEQAAKAAALIRDFTPMRGHLAWAVWDRCYKLGLVPYRGVRSRCLDRVEVHLDRILEGSVRPVLIRGPEMTRILAKLQRQLKRRRIRVIPGRGRTPEVGDFLYSHSVAFYDRWIHHFWLGNQLSLMSITLVTSGMTGRVLHTRTVGIDWL